MKPNVAFKTHLTILVKNSDTLRRKSNGIIRVHRQALCAQSAKFCPGFHDFSQFSCPGFHEKQENSLPMHCNDILRSIWKLAKNLRTDKQCLRRSELYVDNSDKLHFYPNLLLLKLKRSKV